MVEDVGAHRTVEELSETSISFVEVAGREAGGLGDLAEVRGPSRVEVMTETSSKTPEEEEAITKLDEPEVGGADITVGGFRRAFRAAKAAIRNESLSALEEEGGTYPFLCQASSGGAGANRGSEGTGFGGALTPVLTEGTPTWILLDELTLRGVDGASDSASREAVGVPAELLSNAGTKMRLGRCFLGGLVTTDSGGRVGIDWGIRGKRDDSKTPVTSHFMSEMCQVHRDSLMTTYVDLPNR